MKTRSHNPRRKTLPSPTTRGCCADNQIRDEPQRKADDPEILRAFYQRLFPWRYLFQWLNHSPAPTTDFTHREFAFTLANDAYLRYQSYPNSDL